MLAKLYYLWRVVITGSAFLVFNVGGLLLTIIVFPLIRLAIRDSEKLPVASKLVVHYTFKYFVRYMIVIGIMQLKIEGEEILNNLHGKIVIANHPSLIDVVVLISTLKRADCVVKSALKNAPFLGGVVTGTDYICNDLMADEFIERCKASLQKGNNLVIFPEGTRTEPGCKERFKRGAANIAIRTGFNFQPVTISVSPSTLTKDKRWYQVSPRRFTVKVKVLPEYDVTAYMLPGQEPASVRKLTRDIESYYLEELHANG